MDLAQLLQWNLSLFLLILFRWAGMIMIAPVFGARGIPSMVKIGLTAAITIVVYPLIAATNPSIPTQLLLYIAVLLKEALVGLVIGYVISLITSIVQGGGQIIDLQMGFSMGAFIDPIDGTQSSLMGNFHVILATMLLLATNAHYYLIAAMVKSYAYIPINPVKMPSDYLYYAQLVANVFALGIQFALPVFGAILVADVGVGLLARTVPQLNIFSVVFTVKIIFGLIILYLALPFLSGVITHLFNLDMSWVLKLYQGWKQ